MLQAFRKALVQARQHQDLYFAALLEEELIRQAMGAASLLWQGWVYTPAVTIWVFLSQCLSADHSCRDAVARLMAWRVTKGQKPCSPDTGAYCTARDALPENACRQLVRRAGQDLEAQAPRGWLWHGRQVRVVDGTTITMPDTPANQAEYPQQQSQKPGCGFPILRLLVVFSLSVGAVLDAAIAPCQGKRTGENSLFRTLHDLLNQGDVVLADRYFSGWFDIALLVKRGVDVVVRKHQLRATDFRTGQRLGHNDQLVRWSKPQRPAWMSHEQYAALPDELVLREVRVAVTQRGFRTRVLIAITTLVDAEQFSTLEIGELYRRRWQGELHLRSLKIVLQMDHLRCLEPHRVRNELHMHLLGYNVIRRVMALAAIAHERPPWQISFKGALQNLTSFLPLLATCMPLDAGLTALLQSIAAHEVDNRPDRYEPRRRKRRHKNFKYFRMARQEYRNRMK